MGEEQINRRIPKGSSRRRKVVERVNIPIPLPLILAALAAVYLITRGWSLAGLGYFEIIFLSGLAVLCLMPIFLWYRQGMKWLPIGEIFALMHVVYYVFPCFSGRQDWLSYPESLHLKVLLAVVVFLVVFLTTYWLILRNSTLALDRNPLLHRETGRGMMWAVFALWLGWTLLLQSHLLPNVGLYLSVFRSITFAAGSVSVIYLFYQLGQRRLVEFQQFILMGGFLTGLAANLASGFLEGNVELLGAALLAFTLGRKQIPTRALALSVVLVAVLQLGKSDYRTAYWGEGENFGEQNVGLVASYETWLKASWRKIHGGNGLEADQSGLLERTSLVTMLGVVMEATPARLPYLHGQTYAMVPELLVPRVFWPEKPRGTLATETLGIYYGIQTEEGADHTGIAVGPLVEAWANFGWFGLAAAGVFFGLLFGLPTRLTRVLNPKQIGWLLASIFLVDTIVPGYCIAETICSLVTALLMGTVMLVAISRAAPIVRSVQPRRESTAPPVRPQHNTGDSLPG